MGRVIAFKNNTNVVVPEVVEYFESMAAKARSGRVRGWMGVADFENGKPRSVALGTFAEDPTRAVKAAEKWVEVLREKLGPGEKNEVSVQDYVPARLRTAMRGR